jgi:CCR4-NOT transcription complex subunit 4
MAVPTVKQHEDVKPKEVKPVKVLSSSASQVSDQMESSAATIKPPIAKPISKPAVPRSPLDGLMAALCSGNLSFTFNEAAFTPEEMAAVKRHPNLIDPFGGAKMRLRGDKEAAERAKFEMELAEKLAAQEQVQSEQLPIDTNADEDNVPAGSLALGGEPEEDLRSTSARGTIQRPTQPTSSANLINDQFANMNGTGRSLTPQQRQQLALLSGLQQAPGLGQPSQPMLGSEAFDFDRRGTQFSSQSHYDSIPGHQRQGSRYFNNENIKSSRNQAASFYTSGVQGPPPGLKTAGTPPFSGGATFAHGQGFTSSVNAGFGGKDLNADYARGRSGTGAGHDMSKRESPFLFQNPLLRSPLEAPGPASLNPLYGPNAGAYQDPGLVKQKRKGKKHRHANTSSSGGVVDHADPNILQSRMHPNSAGAGQGLFGGQNQGGYQQSNSIYGGGGGYGRGW